MFTSRMLVALFGVLDAEAAVKTVLAALTAIANPFSARFAVPSRFERFFHQARESSVTLQKSGILFFDEEAGLEGILPLVTDETCFLMLTGSYGFAEKWDQALYKRLRKAPEKNAMLTGTISAASEKLPPQAFLPAFDENFEENGVLIERGLPLVCSAAPVRTLAVDPALVLGPIDFLRHGKPTRDTLSIAAYLAGFPAYALDRPVLWPLAPIPERRLRRPTENVLPGTTLARFEQLAGFRYEMKRAGIRTTWGLFNAEGTYAQQLPPPLAVSQRAKALYMRAREGRMPLVVTAFIDLPAPQKPVPVYILRFGFLQALQNLPLLLYTGGRQERLLRASFPNAWSYPDSAALPGSLLKHGMTAQERMKRSKLLVLLRTIEQHPEFTHVAWANIDLIRHPICPDAAPDFSHLMDDRVHFATVNAAADLSFMMLPAARLKRLAREIRDMTELDVELRRSFNEEALMERLVSRYPDWFALHPMPQKHLLMHTAFDPPLLSEHYQALLKELPPVWRGEPEGKKEKKLWRA